MRETFRRNEAQYSVKQLKIAFEALKCTTASSSLWLQSLVNYDKSSDYIPHTEAQVHKQLSLSLSLSQSNTWGFLQAKSDFWTSLIPGYNLHPAISEKKRGSEGGGGGVVLVRQGFLSWDPRRALSPAHSNLPIQALKHTHTYTETHMKHDFYLATGTTRIQTHSKSQRGTLLLTTGGMEGG